MDEKWDWARFLSALEGNEGLQEAVAEAMAAQDLRWRVNVLDGGDIVGSAAVVRNEPLTWDEEGVTENISWGDFVTRLRAVENGQWCDLWLRATMDKAAAAKAGPAIAEMAVEVYHALRPLYEACWR